MAVDMFLFRFLAAHIALRIHGSVFWGCTMGNHTIRYCTMPKPYLHTLKHLYTILHTQHPCYMHTDRSHLVCKGTKFLVLLQLRWSDLHKNDFFCTFVRFLDVFRHVFVANYLNSSPPIQPYRYIYLPQKRTPYSVETNPNKRK